MISDEILDLLGEQFETQGLLQKGWTFIQYVEEYQHGYISIQ